MADITLDVDTTQVSRFLRDVFEDQMPFATSRAINMTALDFQREQRQRQRDVFNVRNKTFMDRAVKIRRGDFATKRDLRAIVRIDPPGGRDDILTKFEKGGTKRPLSGRSLAVPRDFLRTKTGRVRATNKPSRFDFKRSSGRTAAVEVYRGRRRTFLIRHPDGTGGIYQRTGSGARLASYRATRNVRDLNVRVLFRFTATARIDDRLQFVDTAQRVVATGMDENFRRAFDEAIRTAKRASRLTTTRAAERRLAALLRVGI